jgi:hypothetical protein
LSIDSWQLCYDTSQSITLQYVLCNASFSIRGTRSYGHYSLKEFSKSQDFRFITFQSINETWMIVIKEDHTKMRYFKVKKKTCNDRVRLINKSNKDTIYHFWCESTYYIIIHGAYYSNNPLLENDSISKLNLFWLQNIL